ncbi:MAG: UvrD-helicase domain-containing protein [Defluviitaleaceae bacterium]|nr:UvrD-helicase domain-containing protein [Defluviitaleaceae bacterium]MCL2263088.1 UvrD-helicase domain-containing protein [Defluviitaleaceae bacterium]
MNYLDKLNPTQREAAKHTEGPLLIFAGAGSGKTRVLTYRVAHLIEQGVDPYNIIAITFTNKAAKEMRERISDITPLGEQVWVSTFHAACTRILRREIDVIGFDGGFSIYDTADTLRLLKECIKEKNLSDTHYPPRYVAQIISAHKNELVSPTEYERGVAGSFRESNIAEVYSLYQKRLKDCNALDFDDIIFRTVELLSQNEEIRLKYQNRFRYVMVDEYQDTNHAQYELVRLLSGYAQNLCVVGDDDQSIYGWRGADIANILRFEKDYPGAKVVKLEQNYRSSKVILDAANAVISQNEERADKLLWTENQRGEPIRIYTARDERDEGYFVTQMIERGVQDGARYGDFAVLYRTNAQSRGIEDQLVTAGIPYRIFSGVRFYEHMEVKDILAYLKAINNSADEIAHLRIINVPRRGIGQASLDKIRMFAAENGLTFSRAISRAGEIDGLGKKAAAVTQFATYLEECAEFAAQNSVQELMQKILNDTDYMLTIQDGTPESEERVANINELLAKAAAFQNESEDTSLAKFLEDVALVADIDNYTEGADAAALMTLHSAKGLEFDTVFLVGFEEYLFPTSRAIDSGLRKDMEEERRLCYVGFTRAKKTLYLTHAVTRRRYDHIAKNKTSRFLDDVPQDCITSVNMYGREKINRPTQWGSPVGDIPTSEYSVSDTRRDITNGAAGAGSQGTASLPPALAAIAKPSSKPPELTPTAPAMGFAQLKQLASGQPIKQPPPRPIPTKAAPPSYSVGDKVSDPKYGVGEVTDISPAGADYEVTVQFVTSGRKKFMAGLARFRQYTGQ